MVAITFSLCSKELCIMQLTLNAYHKPKHLSQFRFRIRKLHTFLFKSTSLLSLINNIKCTWDYFSNK